MIFLTKLAQRQIKKLGISADEVDRIHNSVAVRVCVTDGVLALYAPTASTPPRHLKIVVDPFPADGPLVIAVTEYAAA